MKNNLQTLYPIWINKYGIAEAINLKIKYELSILFETDFREASRISEELELIKII